MSKKLKITGVILLVLIALFLFFYFKYFFTYEQRNVFQRKVETITGQNLTVTIFGFDGRIIKRWVNVKKISAAKDTRNYTFFYTQDGRYVQIPDSVWYIAEEE